MEIKPEDIGLKGRFEFEIRGPDGEVKEAWSIDNTTTDAGKAAVAGLINGTVSEDFQWIALGDSGTTAASGDTALASEITAAGLGRAEATTSRVTTDVSNDTAQLVHTFTATASQTVKESGIFDTSSASSGTMLAHQTFTAKNMATDDTLEATWQVDVD